MRKERTVFSYLDKAEQIPLTILLPFIKQGRFVRNSLTWTGGSSILYTIYFDGDDPVLNLNYTCGGKLFNYDVQFVSIRSNLGKGQVLYMICPVSGKRCRILYLVNKMFVHRQAYPGQHYYHQTDSKKDRPINCLIPKRDRDIAKQKPETMRVFYKGEFTKRYLRYVNKQRKWNNRLQLNNESLLRRLQAMD